MTINPFILHGEEITPVRKLLYLKAFAGGGGLSEYEITGNPVAFNTNVQKPLSGFTIPFLPVQSGTGDPSPENVRPISGWSGVTAWRTGVNLFDVTTYPFESGKWVNGNDGSISANASYKCIPAIPFEGFAGAKITLNKRPGGNSPGIAFYSRYEGASSGQFDFISGVKNNNAEAGTPMTATVPNGTKFIRFTVPSDATEVQLEVGETPSPYTEYTGQSYPVTFPAVGKNLLNTNRTVGTPNPSDIRVSPRVMDENHYYKGIHPENYYVPSYVSTTVAEGSVSVTLGSAGNNSYGVGFPVAVKGGQAYTLNFTADKVTVSVSYYDDEWEYIGQSEPIYKLSLPATFTVPTGVSFAVVIFRANNNETYTYSDIMLNEGSTALPYEPFTNTVYGATVYPLDGRMLVEWEYAVLNDPDKWSEVSDSNYKFIYDTGFPQRKKYQDSYTDLLCSSFVADSTKRLYCRWNGASGGKFAIQDKDSTLTLADVKQMATDGDIAIAFPIATPYEIQLDPITVQTLIGDNTIWTDTNGENTIKYKKKG